MRLPLAAFISLCFPREFKVEPYQKELYERITSKKFLVDQFTEKPRLQGLEIGEIFIDEFATRDLDKVKSISNLSPSNRDLLLGSRYPHSRTFDLNYKDYYEHMVHLFPRSGKMILMGTEAGKKYKEIMKGMNY